MIVALRRLLSSLTCDSVNLGYKGKLLAACACFVAILSAALLCEAYRYQSAAPILIASMGASAVILFIIPNSPLAQPWPLVGGHLVSALIGITCARLIPDAALASACAAGGSVLAMLLLRCLHPPGAATALTPVMASQAAATLDYDFVLMPVGVNVAVMLMMAVALNRWLLGHRYPIDPLPAPDHADRVAAAAMPVGYPDISQQQLAQILDRMEVFVDVSTRDLSLLLAEAHKQNFIRRRGVITCAAIMKTAVPVEYGTEVQDAWNLMCRKQLNALPVIDKSGRVIGLLTRNDFFKFVTVAKNETVLAKFQAFIRRTPNVATDKPEAVGHIMTRSVAVLPETAHIAELIPLMANQGYRQVPIVNSENRLIGMVEQTDLIAAMYGGAEDVAG